MEAPLWTDVEKRFLMAEMIKMSELPIVVLIDICGKIKTDWLGMLLPPGRTLRQAMAVARDMIGSGPAIDSAAILLQPSPMVRDIRAPRSSFGSETGIVPDYRKRPSHHSDDDFASPAKRQATLPTQLPRSQPTSVYHFSPSVPMGMESYNPPVQPRPDGPGPTSTPAPREPPAPAKRRGRPPRISRPSSSYPPLAPRPEPAPPSPTTAQGLGMAPVSFSPSGAYRISASPRPSHLLRQAESNTDVPVTAPYYGVSLTLSGPAHKQGRTSVSSTDTGARPRVVADEDRMKVSAARATMATFEPSRPESLQIMPLRAQALPPFTPTSSRVEADGTEDYDSLSESLTLPPLTSHLASSEGPDPQGPRKV